MKYISRLLILCLLLVGCSNRETVEPVFTPAETVTVQGLYDKASNLEISSSGAIQVFPIAPRSGKGIFAFGDGILMLSGGERTTLTLFTGDTLVPTAREDLDFCLEAADCAIHGETLSFFDPLKQQTILLNSALETVKTIPAPQGLLGTPRLSEDGTTLYYCTAAAIRGWDLQRNIHRILRESSRAQAPITRLSCLGDVLRCDTSDGCFFLSPETGELLAEMDTALKLSIQPDGFVAASWETNLWSLIFQTQEQTKALTPRSLSAEYFLLPNAVVTAAISSDVVTLDCYDLATGKRTASQMLRGDLPHSVIASDEKLYLLMYLPEYESQAILRWDISRTPVSDSRIYTAPHFTAQNPDHAGLSSCQDYADEIGQHYGLNILIWQDAARLTPEGLSVKPEHRVNILMRELELLEHRLSRFPDGVLQTTCANFEAVNLGLVAQISGGIQGSSHSFFQGQEANILLAVGDDSEENLYHQLFHVMQTHILSHSSAFDQWNTLNPPGFQYDYDYAANAIRNSGIYLTEKNRYFSDTFSMSYPKEDQARVFECAMMPGYEPLFKGKQMQKKLKAVCTGIRASYKLPEGGTYPWEMYLQ